MPLTTIDNRLEEELSERWLEPDSTRFMRAVGSMPVRRVARRHSDEERTLSLDECLKMAFEANNEVKQDREAILAVGGSKLIANSRFLPSLTIISQYERIDDLDSTSPQVDTALISATIRQRLIEYGKDNPIDIALRAEQRQALFNYENGVARVFSLVRRAFHFIHLKEQQIAARRQSLEQFEVQFARKQRRMEAGNLSVKIEVLTARLNVLNEKAEINTLEREKFNREMELLRSIGLPVGADMVEFVGQKDRFGLIGYDGESMVALALSQSSDVALAEAIVSEQKRRVDQDRFEYLPDLRAKAGYQDRHGRVGTELSNEQGTWGLDVLGQPGLVPSNQDVDGLGLFPPEAILDGPNRGWFAGVQVRFPVMRGGARRGRSIQLRAFLASLKAALADAKDQIELRVRQGYRLLLEQVYQVELARENLSIERDRLSIQEQLRDVGRIDDDALERFRENFFRAQDSHFREQERLIERQENLRIAIRYFK